MRHWDVPIQALRQDLGLGLSKRPPLWGGQPSPACVLAMFPRLLAGPRSTWPPQARVTGPLFWDEDDTAPGLQSDLERFLASGPAPVVFTLGSAAVKAAGRFYADSLAAAQRLGRRALLLVGDEPANRAQLPGPLPTWAFALPYAPHARVFRAAEAIVHQGGMGTLAQAMRAGKPMLIVPFSHDQPDNAARAAGLGIARMLPGRGLLRVERGARAALSSCRPRHVVKGCRDRPCSAGRGWGGRCLQRS